MLDRFATENTFSETCFQLENISDAIGGEIWKLLYVRIVEKNSNENLISLRMPKLFFVVRNAHKNIEWVQKILLGRIKRRRLYAIIAAYPIKPEIVISTEKTITALMSVKTMLEDRARW